MGPGVAGAGEEAAEAAEEAAGRSASWCQNGSVKTSLRSGVIGVASGEAGRDTMAARQAAGSLMIMVDTFGKRRFNALPARYLVMEWVL